MNPNTLYQERGGWSISALKNCIFQQKHGRKEISKSQTSCEKGIPNSSRHLISMNWASDIKTIEAKSKNKSNTANSSI